MCNLHFNQIVFGIPFDIAKWLEEEMSCWNATHVEYDDASDFAEPSMQKSDEANIENVSMDS